ncbi:hypothetical protein DPEC_G00178470 [Dallia pectoralis]|uniref:Uncharacterized protein n=1 Tax=Dallia pectoralis TaxID=75939 RepID=A0ACC2GFG1_DALPE|nr:hypothetical protein DPEC_G00178470 [Dallia pectoralis]
MTPSSSEELQLMQAGLGKQNVSMNDDFTHSEVSGLFCDAFPKMKSAAGGWLLFKASGGQGRRRLNLVSPQPEGYSGSTIRCATGGGKTMLLEDGAVRDGWLLGDSGHPLKQWLLTPFLNPQSAEERHYNMCHSQACAIVERTIELFKGRWRCLDSSGGRLMYTPEKDGFVEDTAAAGGLRCMCLGDAGPRRLLSCSTGTTGPAGSPSD